MAEDRDEMLLGGRPPQFDSAAALARFRARAERERTVARPRWMTPALAAASPA